MRLRLLEAEFLRIETPTSWRRCGTDLILPDGKIADGIFFVCPKCFVDPKVGRGTRIGVHAVICWFRNVPQTMDPKPGRWTPSGTSIDDLTFVAGSPALPTSVLLPGTGCRWHGFVRGGDAA